MLVDDELAASLVAAFEGDAEIRLRRIASAAELESDAAVQFALLDSRLLDREALVATCESRETTVIVSVAELDEVLPKLRQAAKWSCADNRRR